MEIKVIRVPGATVTVEIPEGHMVAQALESASVYLGSGEACKLNGSACEMHDVCHEGDKIIVAKGAKGNI